MGEKVPLIFLKKMPLNQETKPNQWKKLLNFNNDLCIYLIYIKSELVHYFIFLNLFACCFHESE